MRVALLHRGYLPDHAGATTMALATAERLRAAGHDVAVVMADPGGDATADPGPDAGAVLRVPWPDASAGAPDVAERIAARLERADVVHAFDLAGAQLPALAEALAARWHAALALTPASAAEVWPEPDAAAALCRAAAVVFVHTTAEAERMEALGVEPDRLVAHGQGPLLRGTPDPAGLRRRHGLGDDPVVLFLGRKTASKGYGRLLAATALVWRERPDVRFLFVGPRWDADCAARFAAHADPRIVELGLVDETTKHSALAACALLCLPSVADVAPLTFAEAWACGRPVVSGPFDGAAELLEPGGGVVCEADERSIARALLSALDDPALSEGARRRSDDDAGWAAIAARIEEGYRAALDTGTPALQGGMR